MKFEKVLVFGGTHGNEWTGIYTIKKFSEALREKFSSLHIDFVLANPEAFKLNKRFKDEDLNRAFQYLHEIRPNSYEHLRAKEIKSLIDDRCFVIDLHTTTSNMGNTIIISHDRPENFAIAAKLVEQSSDTRILFSPDPGRKYLASQSQFGMMIEVGPVPNGVIQSQTLLATKVLLEGILSELTSSTNLMSGSVEIYEEAEDVFYPQSQGEIAAFIHEDFQGKDFQELQGDYWPFRTFEGEMLQMKTTEPLFPVFINEAAYYPGKLAFTLCRKNLKHF